VRRGAAPQQQPPEERQRCVGRGAEAQHAGGRRRCDEQRQRAHEHEARTAHRGRHGEPRDDDEPDGVRQQRGPGHRNAQRRERREQHHPQEVRGALGVRAAAEEDDAMPLGEVPRVGEENVRVLVRVAP
jgi:hypothetical protein